MSKSTSAAKLVELDGWHFDYFLNKEEADKFKCRALGRTLVSAKGTPLGFGGVYFDENDQGEAVAIVFFYGGPNQVFVRKYLPTVMRACFDSLRILKGMGVRKLYAVADRSVPNAMEFIRWFGGEKLEGAEDPSGDFYVIDIERIRR